MVIYTDAREVRVQTSKELAIRSKSCLMLNKYVHLINIFIYINMGVSTHGCNFATIKTILLLSTRNAASKHSPDYCVVNLMRSQTNSQRHLAFLYFTQVRNRNLQIS